MRYRFVAAERAAFPVRVLCRIVGVAVSGFYAWLRRRPARRREGDQRVSERIRAIFAESRRTYGSPRVHAELRAEGVRVGRKRVARLMREGGLAVARRRRRVPRTTDSRHDLPVAPNLLDRHFASERPDAVWLADLSYIPTGEGWLYLAAIKDMATREIVGWGMADHLREELARDALLMAIQRRQPPPGLIHHSDRGVQRLRRTRTSRALAASRVAEAGAVDELVLERAEEALHGRVVVGSCPCRLIDCLMPCRPSTLLVGPARRTGWNQMVVATPWRRGCDEGSEAALGPGIARGVAVAGPARGGAA